MHKNYNSKITRENKEKKMTTHITNAPVNAQAYVQVEGGVNNYTNTLQPNVGGVLGGQSDE